jgi:hypothetical protein
MSRLPNAPFSEKGLAPGGNAVDNKNHEVKYRV